MVNGFVINGPQFAGCITDCDKKKKYQYLGDHIHDATSIPESPLSFYTLSTCPEQAPGRLVHGLISVTEAS